MKKSLLMILATSAISLSSFAYSCAEYEAQIIGKGKVIVNYDNGTCMAKIKSVASYDDSALCPLSFDTALSSFIKLTPSQCESVETDGYLSGILVKKENKSVLILE